MKNYVKNYPRPQMIRENWQNLDGSWDFSFDDANRGEKSQWFTSFPKDKTITVPFTYETKLSGIGDETLHNYVWYHRTVNISAEDLMSNRTVLHFEGSDYITKVWVNGQFAGVHSGAYARFSFDVSTLVHEGENSIVVKAEDLPDEQQPRGKQRWVPENYGCWYVQTTGIWKTVWMEFVPTSSVERLKITPVLSERSVALEFDIASAEYSENMTLEAVVTFEGKFVNKVIIPVFKSHVTTSIDVYSHAISEWGIRTWSPASPDLYDLDLTLCVDGKAVDTVSSYFGMRDIRIEGKNVLLNGAPIYQRLILDQGYWEDSHLTPPSEEALIEDIDKIMALGYNGLRKHQKTEDERFLYWCDVKGMLVWSEVGAAYSFSDYAVTEFTNQWMEIVKQNYNHPSIITWTPINESWGVRNIKTDFQQQKFSEAIYYLTKAYDKNRPVIVNDGWEHTISDIITLHDYEEFGDRFFERYVDFKDEVLGNEIAHCGDRFAFANCYGYRGQPIIISEFGGIAFNNDDSGWGYGNKVETAEAFIKRFDDITTAIKEIPFVCGYCYTQVTDVQQEINGLMDIKRNFKIDADTLKEINCRVVNSTYRL